MFRLLLALFRSVCACVCGAEHERWMKWKWSRILLIAKTLHRWNWPIEALQAIDAVSQGNANSHITCSRFGICYFFLVWIFISFIFVPSARNFLWNDEWHEANGFGTMCGWKIYFCFVFLSFCCRFSLSDIIIKIELGHANYVSSAERRTRLKWNTQNGSAVLIHILPFSFTMVGVVIIISGELFIDPVNDICKVLVDESRLRQKAHLSFFVQFRSN